MSSCKIPVFELQPLVDRAIQNIAERRLIDWQLAVDGRVAYKNKSRLRRFLRMRPYTSAQAEKYLRSDCEWWTTADRIRFRYGEEEHAIKGLGALCQMFGGDVTVNSADARSLKNWIF